MAFEALDGIKSCADPKLMQRLTERLSAAKIDHTRSPVLPDVPAIAEVLPGYEFSAWYGLGAPKATPPDVVDLLNREVSAALADPPFSAQLAELGGTPLPGSPADFARLIAADTDRIGKVIKAASLVLEQVFLYARSGRS
ncbi:tripartite tricarboxylate transporter substrate-binding protein [Reyranella sp.]|uniref:tripartite tricarboxylate transporter substrate-binding protein n=1 Tax=Reyranella sp. TaxID=1929291 RepID=UPI003D103E13